MNQDNQNIQLTFTPEQLQQLMDRLGIKGESVNQILDKFFARIAGALVKEDLDQIKSLNETDNAEGDKVKEFLKTKVPNLDKIIQEETAAISTYASN